MKHFVYVERALINDSWQDNVQLTIDDGLIIHVQKDVQADDAVPLKGWLIPGFFDTQVNGGGGVLFNHSPTAHGLNTIAKAHLGYGTTSMLPTLITDEYSVIECAADAIAQVITDGHPTIEGVHFEGPHLAKAKKGVHPEKHIRSLSDAELALFLRKDLGKVMVTLAPETVSVDVINLLQEQGVIVSLGHSNASNDIVKAALKAGATGFTHLYNAMSPLQSREPGMVGQALLSDAYCGLIVDNQHVHEDAAKLAIKAKGYQKTVLVTDAMAHVGADTNRLPFFDTHIDRVGNKLITPDNTLAGSCLDMHSAVINTHQSLGVSLAEACLMASTIPAHFCQIHNKIGQIAVNQKANFLLLNEDLNLQYIWVKGDKHNVDSQLRSTQ